MTWWLSSCWRRHRVPSWGSLGCPVVGEIEGIHHRFLRDSWIVWSPYEMLESSRSRWKLCLAVKFLNQRRGWTVDVGLHPSRSGVSGFDDIVRSAQCLENAHGGLSRGQPDPDEQDPSESSFTSHLHFDKNTLWTSLNNNMAFPCFSLCRSKIGWHDGEWITRWYKKILGCA